MSSSTVKVPLSRTEQAQVRKFLGYLDTDRAAAVALGIPTASQPLFLTDSAMLKSSNEGVGIVRDLLEELNCIDEQIREARSRRLKISAVKGIKFNEREIDVLWEQYSDYCSRLADILGVPVNPYSRLHQRIGTVPMMTRRPT